MIDRVSSAKWDVLRILSADAWYADPGWMRWLNSVEPATWHKQGDEPDEGSDVWFTYCQGDGSDYPDSDDQPGIPEWIWMEICELAHKHGHEECLVWVSNLGDD